jgi:RNA polymerase sigma factor (sigma-70 family)
VNPPAPGDKLGSAGETAIVALAMSGDARAYGELVRRHQHGIRAMLRRLTRDPSLADDIAQQAFVRGWKAIGTLRSAAAFGAWIRKLAVNDWLAHLRSRRHDIAAEHADASPGAATAGCSVAERLDLDSALSRLAPAVRLCIVLAYSEGMSHAEISASTAIPLGTVKSHIARGATLLRELLEAYGDANVRRI